MTNRPLAKHYQQSARTIADNATLDENASEDILRARDDFGFYCYYLTRNQPLEHQLTPAPHHLEWHKE